MGFFKRYASMLVKLAELWHILLFEHLNPQLHLFFMHVTSVRKRYGKRLLSSGIVLIPDTSLASLVCLDPLDRFLAFALAN